jgi:transcriptional pleiotropic regulator of transition state genes
MIIGTTRRIDQLGRVVVPIELRRTLGIREGDLLEVVAEDGRLILRKAEPECALCGRPDDLVDLREKHLCRECVREIRLEPE